MEKREPSYTVGGNANYYSHYVVIFYMHTDMTAVRVQSYKIVSSEVKDS